MSAYYNEHDKFAAQWLRNLIGAGHIAPGVVDERSIEDVRPSDLAGFRQCHFFAGIGVWSLALRRAGWPDDRPVWTGSCPCQPFSAAGKGAGFDDERHVWPDFFHLIEQCRPAVVAGEQTSGKGADTWVDLVCADLEGMGYAFGAVPFPSAGVGAPHIRDRLYWVADAASQRQHGGRAGETRHGLDAARLQSERLRVAGPWAAADWIECQDGKHRPVEPGTSPLAHGATARVGRLRAYGNAVNAFAAQVFIESVMECMTPHPRQVAQQTQFRSKA